MKNPPGRSPPGRDDYSNVIGRWFRMVAVKLDPGRCSIGPGAHVPGTNLYRDLVAVDQHDADTVSGPFAPIRTSVASGRLAPSEIVIR